MSEYVELEREIDYLRQMVRLKDDRIRIMVDSIRIQDETIATWKSVAEGWKEMYLKDRGW